ncbi:unnamed protein product [Owenia fusiformis]|uniref:Fucosyltransferase n=1 Tax=Owenia fusiformis TaxID=6347 RepID=A0A8J1TVN1_OWEFU|nr:unnamed protein product [Owenia fusiformis]
MNMFRKLRCWTVGFVFFMFAILLLQHIFNDNEKTLKKHSKDLTRLTKISYKWNDTEWKIWNKHLNIELDEKILQDKIEYCRLFPCKNKTSASKTTNKPLKREKTILLYNSFWGLKGWEFGVGSEPFKEKKCPYNQCRITHDRSLLESSDAVLFHITQLGQDKPKIRFPHQRWVFFQMESAGFQYYPIVEYKNWNGLFNWTMTYRRDSDIHIRYGAVLPTSETKDMYFYHSSNAIKLNATKKTKPLAWMASNCNSPGKREQLMKQLEKYMPVDIYGRCTNKKLTCAKNTSAHDRQHDCFTMLEQKYKFYFAAESSMCKGYVTEKLFNTLAYGMVPLVYGLEDYSKILPPHSYIDITKFGNAESLAKFLIDLHNDDQRYEEYFAWKKNYTAFSYSDSYHLSWCDLCKKLHTDTTPKVYQHIDKWWNKDSDCVDPRHLMKSWNIQ